MNVSSYVCVENAAVVARDDMLTRSVSEQLRLIDVAQERRNVAGLLIGLLVGSAEKFGVDG